jgi:hypothetical protein
MYYSIVKTILLAETCKAKACAFITSTFNVIVVHNYKCPFNITINLNFLQYFTLLSPEIL